MITSEITLILIDTNILVAHMARNDRHHSTVTRFMDAFHTERMLVPVPVLVETFFLVRKGSHYRAALDALGFILNAFTIIDLTPTDYTRMHAIMTQYADAKFDFADAALMALSERLNITRVATLDRRDFGLFRPAHCTALELLPA
jgi:predicted nucleic acid-binding protein